MGSICSCLCLDGLEEYIHSDASMHRHCGCLRCLAQQLLHVYAVLSQREEVPAAPLVEHGMNSSTSIIDDSISEPDTYRSPPRPLPYDDPRCSQVQRDKSSSQFCEESEPLRGSNNAIKLEMSTTTKYSGSSYEVASKLCCTKSSLKSTSAGDQNGVTYTFPSYTFPLYEDEDECPTCLEEYTYENPRIVMKCSHHFHLSCIYEWKERSELCPVCGKLMEFDET